MAELVSILEAMNGKEYADKKFAAAMQGVDLDKQTGRDKRPKKTEQKKASNGVHCSWITKRPTVQCTVLKSSTVVSITRRGSRCLKQT